MLTKPPSPQQQFIAQIQRFRQVWPDETHRLDANDEKVLKRLSSDNRMQSAWKLLAKFPEKTVCSFIEDVLIAKSDSEIVPHARANHLRLLKNITKAYKATEIVKRALYAMAPDVMMSRSIFSRAAHRHEEYHLSPLEHFHRFGNPTFEEAKKSLLCINAYVGVCGLRADTELKEINRRISRKGSSGERTEFIRELAQTTKRLFGQPHYEMVAAVTSVVFNAREDISAGSARQADLRRRQYDSLSKKGRE
jgi:hypothetical protein